jgi:hypothetical protein
MMMHMQQQIAKLEKPTSNPTIHTLVELTKKLGSQVLIRLGPPAATRRIRHVEVVETQSEATRVGVPLRPFPL